MTIITLVLLLVMSEILVRFFVTSQSLPKPPPISTIDPYKPNPYITQKRPYIYFHLPGSKYIQSRSSYKVDYEINSMGFRGSEIQPKSQGVKRLITIGDSTTEGHGKKFTDTFSYRLGESLDEDNWEVVNMGVQGGSPIYYAANLERYLSVQPDAALIVIFENDMSDDRTGEQVYFSLPFMDQEEVLLMKTSNKSILNNSMLYTLLKGVWRQGFRSPAETIIATNKDITYTDKEKAAIQKFQTEQDKFFNLKPRPKHLVAPAIFNKQWRMSEAYLNYIVSSFQQRGVAVMIAFLSVTGQEPGLNKAYSEFNDSLNAQLELWAKLKSVPFLSLIPVINDALKTSKIFHGNIVIVDDGHPTAKIDAMIAAMLKPWVIKSLKIKNNR